MAGGCWCSGFGSRGARSLMSLGSRASHVQCAHRWVARVRRRRLGGPGRSVLASASACRATSPQKAALVLAARAKDRCRLDELARLTGVPARTLSRILRRAGVPYLWQCDPVTGEQICALKVTAVRYEHDEPGDLVHIEVKKIGRIPRRWRLECPRQGHGAPGSPEVRAILTGTHVSYAHSNDLRSVRPGRHRALVHQPHCPWQNGKVERFNRTWPPCGPTGAPICPTTNAPPRSLPGSSTTTLAVTTTPSAPPPSPDCHQRDGRVHLAGPSWLSRS